MVVLRVSAVGENETQSHVARDHRSKSRVTLEACTARKEIQLFRDLGQPRGYDEGSALGGRTLNPPMLEYSTGNIFDADVEALVNPVNCMGVMGAGLALQFRKRFPENFKDYNFACRRGHLNPGCAFVSPPTLMEPFIINVATKRHWKEPSKIKYVVSGLGAIVKTLYKYELRSVAIPALGAGLGGLDWTLVKPEIEKAMSQAPHVHAIVFEPK